MECQPTRREAAWWWTKAALMLTLALVVGVAWWAGFFRMLHEEHFVIRAFFGDTVEYEQPEPHALPALPDDVRPGAVYRDWIADREYMVLSTKSLWWRGAIWCATGIVIGYFIGQVFPAPQGRASITPGIE